MSETVINAVEAAFRIPREQIVSRNRDHNVTRARYAAAMLMREGGSPIISIGAALGRHHTTIIDAVSRARAMASRDTKFAACLETARQITKDGRTEAFEAPEHPEPQPEARPPVDHLEAFRKVGDTIEQTQMRADVERASIALGELLRAEVGA